jgi:hypothetical protein
VYSAPATLNLAASITTNGHTINKVQFYNGSVLVAESLAPPYAFTWGNVPAGNYSVSAKAIYDVTNAVTSSSAGVTVKSASTNAPVGLVAAYGFEEGSGTTTADRSGAGNNGSVRGAYWTSNGRFGNALSFNGSSAAVIVNDAGSLDLTSSMTLEAWVKPSDLAAWHEVIYKGDDLYYLEASTPLTSGPTVGIGSSSNPMLSGSTGLALNTWSHLAATYDGATLRVFVNGFQVASRAQTGPISTSSLPLTLGADTLHGTYFAGLIDEVRVYNRALSASELVADMNTPVSGSAPLVTLTSPANGSAWRAPASLPIAADVVANGHTITKVQFYDGSRLLGEDTAAPYVWTATGFPAGTHAISARAVYDSGSTEQSAVATVLVTNPLPAIAIVSPVDGSTSTAPATVTMSASVTANGHSISSVQFLHGTNVLGTVSAAPYTFSWTNVDRGGYTLIARLTYDSGATLDSPPANLTVLGLPLPWLGVDVGDATNGSSWEVGGDFSLSGSGAFGSLSDGFRFVYQTLGGDGELTAQITSFDGTNNAADAGVMIRETLQNDSTYAFIGINGDNNVFQARRNNTGAAESYSTGPSLTLPNAWLRISRSGDNIIRSHSIDGQTWVVDENRKIRMATSIYFGLVVNSGASTVLSASRISNVNATP